MDYDNEIMTTCFFSIRERRDLMEKEKKQPRGFYVERGSFFAHACVVMLFVAIAARLLGTMQLWGDFYQLCTQVALPVGSALLFILLLLTLGRVALWTTILPVLGGAASFILAVTGESFSLRMVICIVLAFFAAFVYTATLAGMIRTKWLNVVVFAGIFAYQIVFLAIPAFSNSAEPVSFASGMLLISSLCLVLAMLLVSLAVRRAKPAPAELPKIKDPKVVAPAPITTELQTPAAPPQAPAAEPAPPAPAAEEIMPPAEEKAPAIEEAPTEQ